MKTFTTPQPWPAFKVILKKVSDTGEQDFYTTSFIAGATYVGMHIGEDRTISLVVHHDEKKTHINTGHIAIPECRYDMVITPEYV
jgi:hypothetical protein